MSEPTSNQKEFTLQSSSGEKIRGNVHLPEETGNAPVLIFCHGFKGFKDWGMIPHLMDAFAEDGWIAIRFNFSLNGIGEDPLEFTELENFKRNTFTQELADVRTVIDAVASKEIVPAGCDPSRIALLGHSRGGGIALITAAEDERVRSVVTWASVAEYDRWGDKTKSDWRERGFIEIMNARTKQRMPLGVGLLEDAEQNSERLDLLRAISAIEVPVLIVHGEQDVSVPVEEGKRLYEASNKATTELALIPNADHTFGAKHPYQGMTKELAIVLKRTRFWLRVHTR
ncbi:MAG: alpha/beta hydrolase [Ectothiorhodospiraceae bacterium]|nr:alpha/beta hydrolase [Ectothiorhodospiraceae bacterium]